MKIVVAMLPIFLFLSQAAAAKSCVQFNRELAELRLEYQTYANSPSAKSGGITFDGLVEILDKIVALQSEMRKANCKVPPRKKQEGRRYMFPRR
ncbi:MAG: hypothetical protein WBG50_27755 [Desulfomonilaceae bacterium]